MNKDKTIVIFFLCAIVLVIVLLKGSTSPSTFDKNCQVEWEVFPVDGETVYYAEIDGNGKVYRYYKYVFHEQANSWENEITCYTNTGNGCKEGCKGFPVFEYAVSITHPNEKVEINNDSAGWLRGNHPRSGFYDNQQYWKQFDK
ncbi:hypothetical protein TetV_432 [Tetraselmis virus 1]|uniref:Uncharacterized protein n=1 Tax=Tetraselmis virus 1 TaxID=2060617 RepID=A0A2P0VNN8_9VIRU|nr:hypothetical protein QJ968_gp622 [Tetraselmis virus 1]AUF82514.1 hypothetical protein TetV_432 [Tetraselmis virus 1]